MDRKPKTIPMKVSFFGQDTDMKVALMGGLGFSTRAIQKETGLTHCQILYRLNKAKIKRSDYRNGESPIAKHILWRGKGRVDYVVRERLEEQIKKAVRETATL